ncbi:MAG: Rho termination factor N-terminal domain-containing protein [Candidatus Aminicenantes bacterium]|nr:MAG: Rho termination factor N-terminal domain-containing protein [Candidatus Aminicenantes bacterium]
MEETHTYEELKKKTVAQLREIAAGIEHEAVKGYTQLNKEHLLEAICKALNLDMHEHHQVVGVDKTVIKTKIRVLKKKRDEALTAHDHAQLKMYRRQIHGLKRKIRKAMV